MYIRWKDQIRASKHTATYRFGNQYRPKVEDTLLVAYLATSERVDGKPKQKTTYLASIRKSNLNEPFHRFHFWRSVQAKIEPLNLSIDQQTTIKNQLLKRVPDVTREQMQASNEEMSRLTASINRK